MLTSANILWSLGGCFCCGVPIGVVLGIAFLSLLAFISSD